MTSWTSWAAAFEVAGKLHASDPAGHQRVTLDLSPAQFAAALKALDAEMEGLSRGDPRYQAACRDGRVTWWDELGRAVEVVRKGAARVAVVAGYPLELPGPLPFAGDIGARGSAPELLGAQTTITITEESPFVEATLAKMQALHKSNLAHDALAADIVGGTVGPPPPLGKPYRHPLPEPDPPAKSVLPKGKKK